MPEQFAPVIRATRLPSAIKVSFGMNVSTVSSCPSGTRRRLAENAPHNMMPRVPSRPHNSNVRKTLQSTSIRFLKNRNACFGLRQNETGICTIVLCGFMLSARGYAFEVSYAAKHREDAVLSPQVSWLVSINSQVRSATISQPQIERYVNSIQSKPLLLYTRWREVSSSKHLLPR